jgi:hypothetical protein
MNRRPAGVDLAVYNEDPEDFGLDPDFDLDDLSMPSCEICGCTEDMACEGGCAWSERFLRQSRMICTSCEPLMIMFNVNLAALRNLQNRQIHNFIKS